MPSTGVDKLEEVVSLLVRELRALTDPGQKDAYKKALRLAMKVSDEASPWIIHDYFVGQGSSPIAHYQAVAWKIA